MHVVIDMKKLRFLPIKHTSLDVIGNLVWIEAPNAHVWIVPHDHNFLNCLTDLQLMLLYKNTTGEPAKNVGVSLRRILYEIADRIPVREVNPFELNTQAELIPEQSSTRYTYCPGSFKPTVQDKLFQLDGVVLPRSENETLIASRPLVRAPSAPAATPATTPAATPVNRPQPAQRGPRTGGVKELIWAVADKMWEAAGSPKDPKIVLNLRKEMMGALESEHSVKKTSSSNELGNWMKARI